MGRAKHRDKGETGSSARRAWLSGLLVWALLLQLLVPALGPLRLGDGTATAALGRIVPICTIDGLRIAEPATGETAPAGDVLPPDGGWHCQLCITPAVPPPAAPAVALPALQPATDWPPPFAAAAPGGRAHRPQTARGPPDIS